LRQVSIDDLKAPKRRVHSASEVHIAEVQASIETFGFARPILVSEDLTIVDGVDAVEAARRLGLTTLPCIVIDHLGEEELRLLTIAINRLPQKAEWDLDVLRIEFEQLADLGAPIEVSGFEAPEIDILLLEDEDDAARPEPGPLEPERRSRAVSAPGDLWLLGEHRILNGNALVPDDYDALLAGTKVRFCFTDEPFNVPVRGHITRGDHAEFRMASGEMTDTEFLSFISGWMSAASAHVIDGGMLASFVDWRGVEATLRAGREQGFELLNLVVWNKSNGGMGSLWRSKHELLPFFKIGSAPNINNVELGRRGRWRSNVWDAPGASSLGSDSRKGLKAHPTVKPVALLVDALLDVTERGDGVLDPFLGSGSTLIAAEKTGRVAFGIELDEHYVDVAIQRWAILTGRDAILKATGETFTQVQARRHMAPDPNIKLLPKPRLRIAAGSSAGADR
jgi:DNA modification methylase